MKILLISDSHGKNQNIEKVLKKVRPVDMIWHLGDLEGSESYLEMSTDCPLELLAGNSDYFSRLPRAKIVTVSGVRFLLAHGHTFGVANGYDTLAQVALENHCQYACFGHTHKPYYEIGRDVTLINPGSISKPRQDDKRPSYALLYVGRKGGCDVEICYLNS